jgi:protein tyrosine phosphatase (PTP) superfamily phosphohydrolase (DUF442 family)
MKLARNRFLCVTALVLGAGIWTGAGPLPLQADDSKLKLAVIPGLQAARPEGWQEWPKSGPIKGVRVENFGVVLPGILYRSGQPGEGDFEWLAQQGIKSVVSMREEYDDGADRLKGLGINYLYLPVTDHRIPTDEQARKFLEFMHDSKNWPVLVHCKGGQGRAAIMSALARYSMQGWTMDRALEEAKLYRPFQFKIFGEQRRFLNSWKDRFAPAAYAPGKSLPAWTVAAEAK